MDSNFQLSNLSGDASEDENKQKSLGTNEDSGSCVSDPLIDVATTILCSMKEGNVQRANPGDGRFSNTSTTTGNSCLKQNSPMQGRPSVNGSEKSEQKKRERRLPESLPRWRYVGSNIIKKCVECGTERTPMVISYDGVPSGVTNLS